MSSVDIHNKMDALPAIAPAVYSSTQQSAIIDTDGAEGIEFIISAGVMTAGSFIPKLEDGDAANLSDAAEIASDLRIGSYADATFGTDDDGAVKKIGAVGHKRYVRLELTDDGTADGLIGAVAVKMPKNQKAIS